MVTATAIRSAHRENESAFSDGELDAWRGLLRAHTSVAKRLDAALEDAHGLPLRAYEVLHRLKQTDGGRMRMSDLADEAQLSRSGLTRLVDRLERDGLLTRCSCQHDARGAYACLTDAGRERLDSAHATHMAVIREHFLSRFSTRELHTLTEMWARIVPTNGNGNGCGPHHDDPHAEGSHTEAPATNGGSMPGIVTAGEPRREATL